MHQSAYQHDCRTTAIENIGVVRNQRDEKLAKKILNNYTPIKRECDKILYALFDEELSPNEAVVTAMLSRYFKRINSHVSNIASGIVYPLNEIDFVTGDILE